MFDNVVVALAWGELQQWRGLPGPLSLHVREGRRIGRPPHALASVARVAQGLGRTAPSGPKAASPSDGAAVVAEACRRPRRMSLIGGICGASQGASVARLVSRTLGAFAREAPFELVNADAGRLGRGRTRGSGLLVGDEVGLMDIDGARRSSDTAESVTNIEEGNMRVRDLMATDVPIARLEDTVRDAARLMDEARVKVLPVCEGNRLVGVLSDSDVICAVADGCAPDHEFVRNYMTADVVTVTPDTQLSEAGQLMAHRRIHHLFVCDDDRFAGIVHVDVEWSQLGGFGAPHATFAAAV